MNKLWLIVQREYLTRVQKKSFILTTLLIPFFFLLFTVVVSFIFSYEENEKNKIAIIDEGGIMNKTMKDENDIYYSFPNEDLTSLKEKVAKQEYNGVLVIPKPSSIEVKDFTVNYYTEDQLSLTTQISLERKIGNKIRDYKIATLGLDKDQLATLRSNVSIDPEPIKEGAQNQSSITGNILTAVGMMLGFIMVMIISINGSQVMMGVMEEKTNRIVEVMVSSVKPFELMLGKLVGIGGVTLTQMAIWAVLFPLIFLGAQLFFGIDTSQTQVEMATAGSGISDEQAQDLALQIFTEISAINWWLIIPAFIIYLLLGFFMYSSLYAAAGSAIGDDLSEAQKLTLPLTLPIILSFYTMIPAMQAPNGSLATWGAIFPISAPFIMPARLAFDPPMWQVLLSLTLLIATTVFFVWLSGRIYRVGIFLYGKKVTFKEMGKWLFYKD